MQKRGPFTPTEEGKDMSDFLNSLYVRLHTGSLRREDGQAMTEYAVILAVIVVAVVATLLLLQAQLIAIFTSITGTLSDQLG
jgi:Flp pilus assembly pilin Flp